MGLASSSTNRVFAVGGGWTANSGRTGSGRGGRGGGRELCFLGGEGRGKREGRGWWACFAKRHALWPVGGFLGGDFLGDDGRGGYDGRSGCGGCGGRRWVKVGGEIWAKGNWWVVIVVAVVVGDGGRWWAMVGDGWVGDFRWLERVFVFLVLFGTGAGCVFGVILV